MTDAAKIAARLDELDRRELTTIEEADLIAIARAANAYRAAGLTGAYFFERQRDLDAALTKLAEGR